jgi:hypothetical protein
MTLLVWHAQVIGAAPPQRISPITPLARTFRAVSQKNKLT